MCARLHTQKNLLFLKNIIISEIRKNLSESKQNPVAQLLLLDNYAYSERVLTSKISSRDELIAAKKTGMKFHLGMKKKIKKGCKHFIPPGKKF